MVTMYRAPATRTTKEANHRRANANDKDAARTHHQTNGYGKKCTRLINEWLSSLALMT